MSSMKKGMQYYKSVYVILTMSGHTIPVGTPLENEETGRTVKAIVSGVDDLPAVNAVLDVAAVGRTRSDVPAQVNEAIEALFHDRARELISGSNDVKYLRKMDKKIDAYAKKETGCCNRLKSEIQSRITELDQ